MGFAVEDVGEAEGELESEEFVLGGAAEVTVDQEGLFLLLGMGGGEVAGGGGFAFAGGGGGEEEGAEAAVEISQKN